MSRFGRNIDIDLSTGKIEQENMSQKKVRQNLSGFGYNVATLYRRIEPGIDAFDPDNLLVISRGLLTGSVAPSSSRIHINALSPLSGLIVSSIIDSLGLCKVPALSIIGDFSLEMEARLIRTITGLDIPPEALYSIGERIVHMEKIFNIRQGGNPADDSLPELFLQSPIEKGPIQGRKVNLVPMVQEFYHSMGWDEKGRPRPSILQKFDLSL